jgi:hypothetical protein
MFQLHWPVEQASRTLGHVSGFGRCGILGPLDIESPRWLESDLTAALRTARQQHNYPAAIPWRPLCLSWHQKAHPELCLRAGPMFVFLVILFVALASP